MKKTVQKPQNPEVAKLSKKYTSLEKTLADKHQKANDFIKKVKLTF
jgi:hypothetical protein